MSTGGSAMVRGSAISSSKGAASEENVSQNRGTL